jgi:predicted ribosomally synthesized peptide with nif11-like leader
MSIEAVAEFTNKLAEDQSLQAEIKSAIDDKVGLEASQMVSEIGAKHGYEFTAEEAETLRQLVLAHESGELNDDQLEAVAGGGLIGDIGGWAGGKIGNYIGGSKGKTVGSTIGKTAGGVVEKIFGGW